jgi:XRE family transcriptional regulator, master regulator for biofilm formation
MDFNILKGIRIQKGYSLTKLSELTGISKSYLSLLERGIQSNPSIEVIGKIAQALKVDINDLIMPTEKKRNHNRTLKLEINVLEDELNQEKLEQIKKLFSLLGKEEEID